MPNPTHRRVLCADYTLATNDEFCCWPDCEALTGPLDAPLCTSHIAKMYRLYRTAADLAAVDRVADSALAAALARPPQPPLSERQGIVYFVRFQERVKIGFTTNMRSRMSAIPHEEVLGTQPGTLADEKRYHRMFAHLRVTGEWFRAEPDLLAFIADIAT